MSSCPLPPRRLRTRAARKWVARSGHSNSQVSTQPPVQLNLFPRSSTLKLLEASAPMANPITIPREIAHLRNVIAPPSVVNGRRTGAVDSSIRGGGVHAALNDVHASQVLVADTPSRCVLLGASRGTAEMVAARESM